MYINIFSHNTYLNFANKKMNEKVENEAPYFQNQIKYLLLISIVLKTYDK